MVKLTFNSAAGLKCRCSEVVPQMPGPKIAIPIKDLDVAQIKDGDSWVMQLVCAVSRRQLLCLGAGHLAAVSRLSPDRLRLPGGRCSVHRSRRLDERQSRLHVQDVQLAKADISINIGVKIVASNGKVLLDRSELAALRPGESREEHVKAAGLALREGQSRISEDRGRQDRRRLLPKRYAASQRPQP